VVEDFDVGRCVVFSTVCKCWGLFAFPIPEVALSMFIYAYISLYVYTLTDPQRGGGGALSLERIPQSTR
jgi:hypothetical protein